MLDVFDALHNDHHIRSVIQHCNPHTGTYTCAPSGRFRDQISGVTYPGSSSSMATGPKDLSVLATGSTVILDLEDTNNPFITEIVEVAPELPLNVVPSSIVPFDVSGGAINDVNIALIKDGRALNTSGATVTDARMYAGHSRGSMNALGVAYGHTATRAFLRASDVCSLETFIQDHLLRVKGFNYQFWSSMGEKEISTSGDTITESKQETYLSHEALGRNTDDEAFGVNSIIETLTGISGKDKAEAAYKELLELAADEVTINIKARQKLAEIDQRYEQLQVDHPQILPRRVSLNGYLGNGEADLVVKPGSVRLKEKGLNPEDATGLIRTTGVLENSKGVAVTPSEWSQDYIDITHTSTKANTPVLTGLSEIQRASDGRVRVASAKSIGIVKEISIPVPNRISTDPDTDSTNFDVSKTTDRTLDFPGQAARTVGRRDLETRSKDRRFVNAHPEWEYDSETGSILDRALGGSDYDPRSLDQHEYDVPPCAELEIDKNTQANYYQGRAGVFLTEDGGIVLQDAYGASIRLTGGNIYVDCPGDIIEMPGRDKNTLAGRNINTRAHNEVELVSSNGNLRVKAEKQLSILGGSNNAQGGILIESQAKLYPNVEDLGEDSSTGGIVVKSLTHMNVETPSIGVYADNTAIQSETGITQVSINGSLSSLDCSADNISGGLIYGSEVHTDVLQASTGEFGGTALKANSSNYAKTLGSGGGVPAPVVNSTKITGEPFVGSGPNMEALVNRVKSDYGFVSPGVTFSFNTSEEYGVGEFGGDYNLEFIEPIWQTRDREVDIKDNHWEEPKLLGILDKNSQPYPGSDLWNSKIFKRPTDTDAFKLDPSGLNLSKFEAVDLSSSLRITKQGN